MGLFSLFKKKTAAEQPAEHSPMAFNTNSPDLPRFRADPSDFPPLDQSAGKAVLPASDDEEDAAEGKSFSRDFCCQNYFLDLWQQIARSKMPTACDKPLGAVSLIQSLRFAPTTGVAN